MGFNSGFKGLNLIYEYLSKVCPENPCSINLFKSLPVTWCTNRFNIQQLYALPTLYLCVLYLSENKQRLLPLTALNCTSPVANITGNWPFQYSDFHRTIFCFHISGNPQGHFARCCQYSILHVVCFFSYTASWQKTFSEFTPVWKWRINDPYFLRVWRRSHVQLFAWW